MDIQFLVRDGNTIFILQLGSNAHGSFLMISELLHGHKKGFIVVPEGKLDSVWRGFGFRLRKTVASETLAVKLPTNDGSGGNKGKQLMLNSQNSNFANLGSQAHDSR